MIKPLKAIAIVDRNNPTLYIRDIYATGEQKHLCLHENEKIINITITADGNTPKLSNVRGSSNKNLQKGKSKVFRMQKKGSSKKVSRKIKS